MRILFLHRHPFENSTGGVAEYLHYLPMSLKEYGIESVFYNEGTDELSGPKVLATGVKVYSGPYIKPAFFIASKKLRPVIDLTRLENINLLHAQGTYRSGYVAMQVFKRTGIPYVITSHSDIVATNSERMKRGKIQRRCREILRQAAAVTHLTPLMADISHQIFDTREKSTLIGNGIDLSGWQPFTSLPEQNYILGIGRLEPEKGFHILIDAYAKLREHGVKTSLVIAGTGSVAMALQEQAVAHGLHLVTEVQDFAHLPEESVIFTGYVRGDLKKQLVAQSKMVLFPTQPSQWEEPFGIVQLEAMAAGKPLVASDSITTRYLESLGMKAALVKADEAMAWAEQIEWLLSNHDLRKLWGEINLANADQFDWDIVARQYRDVYQRVVRK